MTQHNLDKCATIQPELTQLRTTLRGALSQFGHDRELRRALIHAEGVVADRLGERRAVERRSERRKACE